MKRFPLRRRTLALLAVIVPLLALLAYVALRSGPLARVAVTVATVQSQAVTPSLFGIGIVGARYTYKIGPTFAGRVRQLDVHVGDRVQAGQVLGEMDPVDLDDRVHSQISAFKRAEAALREMQARQAFAQTQARRYEQLIAVGSVSEEMVTTKRQELQIADAALSAAREARARPRDAALAQQAFAPYHRSMGWSPSSCRSRTTIVAQAVVEVIDPKSLWIDVRFDQISASGLAAGLSARIELRSRSGQTLNGHVLRTEPKADAVTEETLAKVTFDEQPEPLPPVGELAEVTVDLPVLPPAPTILNPAVRREGDRLGVWKVVDGDLHFTPVKLGAADLEGRVQVLEGLSNGDQVVIYSDKALTVRSRIKVVERIPGVSQ
jgi:RND family efflux transporter MFP subunit